MTGLQRIGPGAYRYEPARVPGTFPRSYVIEHAANGWRWRESAGPNDDGADGEPQPTRAGALRDLLAHLGRPS